MTYAATPSATSSPESASGPTPCVEQGGMTIAPSGPAPAPASPSRRRAKAAASTIRGISGPTSFGSLRSAGLTASLVSRLQQRARGSILYDLTWKLSATPSGHLIYRLRASGARTSASDFTGWPTPTTPSGGQTVPPGTSATGRRPDGSKSQVTLQNVALLAGWSTPTVSEGTGAKRAENKQGGESLRPQAQLAAWPTPMAGTPAQKGYNEAGNTDSSRRTVALATGSPAQTESGGQLRAGHSRWLMRIPPAWDDCGVTATQSMRKSRKTS